MASSPPTTPAATPAPAVTSLIDKDKGKSRSGKRRPRSPRKIGPPLPPPRWSGRLLVRVAPSQVGMFRFLLEAYEHVAYFTVIDRHAALLKIVFSPHRERAARQALGDIGWSLPLEVMEWPC